MSLKVFHAIQRGMEAALTAVLMLVSLAVFWPIAAAHRRYLLR